MFSKFKPILCGLGLLAAAALALPTTSHAQQYKTETTAITNTIAAVSTNTVAAAPFTATKTDEVVVGVSAKLTAAGTTVSLFTFETSTDGTTYDGPTFTLGITQAGTLTRSASTNVNLGAYGYLRCKSIGNGDDDGVLTNIVCKYTTKPERRGQ